MYYLYNLNQKYMNHKDMEIAQIIKYIICKQIITVHTYLANALLQ